MMTRPWVAQTAPGTNADEAYRQCMALLRAHYENFSIASWFLPKTLVPHMAAIYAFARTTDDLGDEATGDRLAKLDAWKQEFRQCYGGQPHHPYLVALQQTIAAFVIPPEPFLKLIHANRMDQMQKRYATYDDLLTYCGHSANPVGHLVLYVFGYRDAERQHLSDATCTGLQLVNFWQDVRRDYRMGRIYIPQEDMARFGCSEETVAQRKATPEFRRLIAFEVERTRALLTEGLPLLKTVRGNLRLDLALFSRGGFAVLGAIEAQQYDVLSKRPTVGKAKKVGLLLSACLALKMGRL